MTDSEGDVLSKIYKDFQWPVDGMAITPTKSGLGYTLNEDAMKEFLVKE